MTARRRDPRALTVILPTEGKTMNPGLYAKAIAGLLVAGLGAAQVAQADQTGISSQEVVGILIAVVGVSVSALAGFNWGAYVPAIATAATSALGAVWTALAQGGISVDERYTIALTVLAAVTAVYAVPNARKSDALVATRGPDGTWTTDPGEFRAA